MASGSMAANQMDELPFDREHTYNLDFLQTAPYHERNATLIIYSDGGGSISLEGLSVPRIAERCPVLAGCFEWDATCRPKASLEASSPELAICFLRYLYLNTYMVFNGYMEEPRSLLVDVQLFRMADIYDVPELQVEAQTNLLKKTELACSTPHPPSEVSEAIKFAYDHLKRAETDIFNILLCYCVSCFFYHKLGRDASFLSTLTEVRAFHNDLLRTNFERAFEDEGAQQIIQLPLCVKESVKDVADKAAMHDFLNQLWVGEPSPYASNETQPKLEPKSEYSSNNLFGVPLKQSKPEPQSEYSSHNLFDVPLRLRHAKPVEQDASSDQPFLMPLRTRRFQESVQADDFTIVHGSQRMPGPEEMYMPLVSDPFADPPPESEEDMDMDTALEFEELFAHQHGPSTKSLRGTNGASADTAEASENETSDSDFVVIKTEDLM